MDRHRDGLTKALSIFRYNAGSCNGCDAECLALWGPRYDLERLGFRRAPSPRQADILFVTGVVTTRAAKNLRHLYEQMASPKGVVAVGVCAVSGGLFRRSSSFAGPLDALLPVDVYLPGCPPRPEALIEGLTRMVLRWEDEGGSEGREGS
ncbi:MAG: NADH-quinone oxidoreductase subunit NuoB [Synergistaceae bacterium]|jgi:membrane-bound hydrogenase subunit mbhJ|nr:NADH-quinone oxidoreductase subunit NuoB [Synergistaceae bacterium]